MGLGYLNEKKNVIHTIRHLGQGYECDAVSIQMNLFLVKCAQQHNAPRGYLIMQGKRSSPGQHRAGSCSVCGVISSEKTELSGGVSVSEGELS